MNNLKQMGLAVANYEQSQKVFPPGYVTNVDGNGNETGPGWGWASMALPQFEQSSLFNAINFNLGVETAANSTGRLATVNNFLCPSDTSPLPFWAAQLDLSTGAFVANICQVAPSNYVGVCGMSEPGPDGEGVFFRNSSIAPSNVLDGLSTTVFVGERAHELGDAAWSGAVTGAVLYPSNGVGRRVTELGPGLVLGHTGDRVGPGEKNSEVNQFYSQHSGRGAHFLFGDGHASFLKSTMNYTSYLALGTRAGSEVVSGDSY